MESHFYTDDEAHYAEVTHISQETYTIITA